jgi:predicted ribosomally synthesized peptide with nif11-like leader
MSQQNVAAFRKRLATDKDLQAQMRDAGQSLSGLLDVASKAGLPFSGADLAAHVQDPAGNTSELSDFELAGGTQYNAFTTPLDCGTTAC